MSGTSLDGLDICWVKFSREHHSVFQIVKAQTVDYPNNLKQQLAQAHILSGLDLMLLHNSFALFCANEINDFLGDDKSQIDLIASHGHTVFHNPEVRLTTQIGNGAVLYAETGIKTVCDFRTVDVALGGQGAPLVPIGDLLLFTQYDSCLNLGGIANISVRNNNEMEAQDLCFANMLSNTICKDYFDVPYDKGGELGRAGKVKESLVQKMTEFHQGNNSLAREGFNLFLELISKDVDPADLLRSAYEYTSNVVSEYCNKQEINNVYVTGGGAHNTFFMELLKQKTKAEVILPDPQIIDFKEALIFAFLGFLRVENKNNVLKTVTKATNDNLGGAVYG